MFGKFFDAIKKTVSTITSADMEDEGEARNSTGTQNYNTYDLSDIFPFKIYSVSGKTTLSLLSKKLNVPIENIRRINSFPSNLGDNDELHNPKVVIEDRWLLNDPKVQELTIGDLLNQDFERTAENCDPPIFYVHYATVRGDALGKLILTDSELLFDPLNPKLKGFINQETDDYFQNRKLGLSINYRDLLPQIDIVRIPDREFQEEKTSLNYYVELQVFNTGHSLLTDEYARAQIESLREQGLPLARLYLKINNTNLLNVRIPDEAKSKQADKIVATLLEKRAKFIERDVKAQQLSLTKIPFFDIDFKSVLRILRKGDAEPLSAQREVQQLQQNLQIFEKFFGFDFGNQRGLNKISNQSLIAIETLYPSIKRGSEGTEAEHLLQLKEEAKAPSFESAAKAKLLVSQGFTILSAPSSIISPAGALMVYL